MKPQPSILGPQPSAEALLPCPEASSCARERRRFALAPGVLFDCAQQALAAMHPAAVHLPGDAHRLRAIFRVFLFKDDVDLVVTPHADGSATLHVRSASRVGDYDFGVNRRRLRRFFEHVERLRSSARQDTSGL